MSSVHIPVAVGELIDKITILEIKAARITEPGKLANVLRELGLLREAWQSLPQAPADLEDLRDALKALNLRLWDIEDALRTKEHRREFDAQFIELARSVYLTNDERSALKRKINAVTGSVIIEEKSYAAYQSPAAD
ncbi:MAG: hypothetical protein E4H37_03955 [Gemmatimonadales bacterium]|jgi:hypothetical protein|nr:MAG: hypothetical protein E4H37_03955 [Gemmatimonadales bacterium]